MLAHYGVAVTPEHKAAEISKPQNLRWKLHRVTPLRHVLDFFTLVNLVNQFRRVIDQPHGRFTRHAGAAQAVDVGVSWKRFSRTPGLPCAPLDEILPEDDTAKRGKAGQVEPATRR